MSKSLSPESIQKLHDILLEAHGKAGVPTLVPLKIYTDNMRRNDPVRFTVLDWHMRFIALNTLLNRALDLLPETSAETKENP